MKAKKKHSTMPWLIGGGILVLAIAIGIVAFLYTRKNDATITQRIVSISASARESYEAGEELDSGDVNVTAELAENGGTVELDPGTYRVEPELVPAHGHDFEITVTLSLEDQDELETFATVLIEREELLRYDIGRTEPEQVQAVLYANGDMEIVGEGEVKQYKSSDIPWRSDEVTYLTWIDPAAEVESMDYWFAGSQVFGGMLCPVPDTVQSMVQTFYQCVAMQSVPDMTTGINLEDITECYSGSGVKDGGVLPGNLKTAEGAFRDCVALIHAADSAACVRLANMKNCYSGCSALADTSTPDCAVNLAGAYQNCLNIKTAVIPSSAQDLDSTFSGCSGLTSVTGEIPATCTNLAGTFRDCKFLSGDLRINCSTQSLSGTFSGAAKNGTGLIIEPVWTGEANSYQTPEEILQNLKESLEQQAKEEGCSITVKILK